MPNEKLQAVIEEFIDTKPEVIDVIGYGSAVKTQSNSDESVKKQIDLIVTTDDPIKWHQENQKENPEEYSKIAKHLIPQMQNFGTNIQYISDIKHNGHIFKVGVISRENFIKDLISWNNFYMAGRMQKPVMLVKADTEIETAIKKNRLNALKVALLLAKKKTISEDELYRTICSLSYMGDIRMKFKFENPKKVQNIVSGEYEEIRKIYGELNDGYYFLRDGSVTPNNVKLTREIITLPQELLFYIRSFGIDPNNIGLYDVEEVAELAKIYIKKTNLRSSVAQPIKGLVINNFSNSHEYLKEKRKKYTSNI